MTTYLEPSHHKSWETNGYLRISGFFSGSEVAALRQWVAEIESWEQDPGRWIHHYESVSDGTRLSRTENFIPYHEAMKSTLTTAKVPDAIAELNGEPAVLYKEKINYKYPGGGGYAPHQDAPAYEFVKSHTTCLISIDAATVENGCLFFSPGRHREGMIALDADGCIAPDVAESMDWVPAPTQPGDILLFSSYIPHKSGANGSNLPRRINLRRLQQSLRRGLAGQILRGQTSGFFTIRGGRFGKIRSNQQNSPFSRKDGIER